MARKSIFFILFLTGMIIINGCEAKKQTAEKKENNYPGIVAQGIALEPVSKAEVEQRLDIYAPFELTADVGHLTDKQKQLLVKLFDVADIMNELFWKQAIGDRESFLQRITDIPTKEFAKINYGPWDRLNNNKPFIKEVGTKPKGANFYPTDMTIEEFEAFDNPNKTSLYTLIRRDENGSLKTVWYHEAYKSHLQKAASLMKEAAALAEDPYFKNYLENEGRCTPYR